MPLLPRLLLTGMSAALSETCTFPFDAVKTRLQLQGEAAAAARATAGATASVVSAPVREVAGRVGRVTSRTALSIASEVIHHPALK